MYKNNFFIRYLPGIFTTLLLFNIQLFSQDTTLGVMDINNITSWVASNGFHPNVVKEGGVAGGSWNGTFPKRTAGAIYTEGVVWGGLVNDGENQLVRVGGSTYFNGNFALTRLYRVRPYYDKVDLKDDASSTFRITIDQVTDSMITLVYNQYKRDWDEWPADKGAPFNDINKDGVYEPSVDVPGIPGASQTIWISYDDRNSIYAYASQPIGLEVHETYWAYGGDSTLSNVIYKDVKLIYKGINTSKPGSQIDSMYIVEYSDVDDGQYYDDFVGCDTSLNLGYVYNSSSNDPFYSKFYLVPPAVGYTLLQGVAEKTGNLSDRAIVDFKWKKGYRFFNSVPMTGFIPQKTGDYYGDPLSSYTGTLQFYNLMRGYRPSPSYPASIPFLDFYGKYIVGRNVYILNGDPVTGTGWIDGIQDPAGARSLNLITGPFHLNLDDTAEVTLALVGGGGFDNISSISTLRYYTRYAIASYNYFVQEMTEGKQISAKFLQQPKTNALPEHYVLSQNYPNPFNPTTTIEYELSSDAFVKLVVYDVLGREIRTLVNEQKAAGSYKVIFDGSNLPSGVYFYRITFTNSDSKLINDNLIRVNKLMLIK